MLSTARHLGEAPTAREVAEQALALARELAARIAALEAKRDAEDEVDGDVQALPSSWRPIKAAAAEVGYSVSGLRAATRRHTDGPRWWKFRAGRLLVNIETCPRKKRT
jgi:hypothetical protein